MSSGVDNHRQCEEHEYKRNGRSEEEEIVTNPPADINTPVTAVAIAAAVPTSPTPSTVESAKRRLSTSIKSSVELSLQILSRSIALVKRLKHRSEQTQIYLDAALIVVPLREAIISNDWNGIQDILDTVNI